MKQLNLRLILGVMVAILASMVTSQSWAFPQPAPVPTYWELDFKAQPPSIISLTLPGQSEPKLFWYFTYNVVNNTGAERLFIPDIVLLTDAGDLLPAGKGVPAEVFARIKAQSNNPLLEAPAQALGNLLQGPDHARDSLAIFPVPDHDVNKMTIFVGGLSGETAKVPDAITHQEVLLRKTLAMVIATPGDQLHVMDKPVTIKSLSWVMR